MASLLPTTIFGLFLVVLCQILVWSFVDASCRRAGLCCEGKNASCQTSDGRSSCYCDAACVDSGDCCDDFSDTCKAVDCVLDETWGPWGRCSKDCGSGIKQRHRRILQHPKNGGRPCGTSVQTASCQGTNCKMRRSPYNAMTEKETGKIILARFARWRLHKQYNPYKDIRRNLFEHYKIRVNEIEKPSYCAKYEITDARPGCQTGLGSQWTQNLRKGSLICVECQSTAMKVRLGGRCRGHGVYMTETHWATVTSSRCYGSWVMKSEQTDCQCDSNDNMSFIFV